MKDLQGCTSKIPSMHRVPAERVMHLILRVSLHGGDHGGTETDEHGDRKDDDEQRQQQDEGERGKNDARRECFPAKLFQLQPDGPSTQLTAVGKDMLLPEPDQQRSERNAEGTEERGLHPAKLPDTVETAVYKTRFGVLGTGGLLKRGRLSSMRVRDRVHGWW